MNPTAPGGKSKRAATVIKPERRHLSNICADKCSQLSMLNVQRARAGLFRRGDGEDGNKAVENFQLKISVLFGIHTSSLECGRNLSRSDCIEKALDVYRLGNAANFFT